MEWRGDAQAGRRCWSKKVMVERQSKEEILGQGGDAEAER